MMDSTQLPRFSLSLLGRFELTTKDGVVRLPSRKLAGLLAYLACKAPQPREKLANLLWGSHYETQARQNLRQALFRLRRILGQDALINNDDDVWLAPGLIDCDAVRFEALSVEGSCASLAAACDLYAGPLLTDLNITEDAWSDWRGSERERLEGIALDAMVGHSRQAMRVGNAEIAFKVANRAIAVNALREDAHRLIVQALVATGRKAEALRHYQDLATLLKQELNTEPDAITQSLVAELRSARPPGASPTVNDFLSSMHGASGQDIQARTTAAPTDDASTRAAVRPDPLEQRQLTFMVCSLIGSMPPSAGLDPEDVHDLITAFHKMIADIATRHDGFVAQYQGYGALVYFGYPAAHEHDAEQSVRAGLSILDAVGKLTTSSGEKIQASVGIATGPVVIDERSAADDRRRHVAIGEAPSLATRLQTTAAAGEITIAASTRRLVGRMFECRQLHHIDVEAWQVHGEMVGVSRFDARRGDVAYPFIGRQEELALLLRRWDQAKSDAGHVVLISGESGIGKSRVAESLLARLDDEPHTRLRYFCSPHHTHSALHPFIAQVKQDAGFEPDDSDNTRLDRLEALLKPTATNLPRDVALVAELVGVPIDGRYPTLTASPQQKREMTLDALLSRLNDAASRAPILIVFEDAHWIDPTSLDLLERMATRAASLPILLIVTLRPEFQPGWVGQPHVTALSLSRLGPKDSAGIIHGIALDKALPDIIVEQILSRADGVPLFIEELTRTLLESGLLHETTDGYVLNAPLPPLAIPTTLQASLVARLDLLGSARDVAMIGAAIGREFSHELVAEVSSLTPMDLDAALARLMASGLISRRGTRPEASYLFKHALVQDAAYVTMLKSRQRQLHASIARTLVERFPTLIESQPEIVARHFMEAGLASDAIGYWVKAGRLAHARWANREAAGFFEQALHALGTLPETRETLQQAIDLRFDLKTSLTPLGQFERIVSYLRETEGLAKRLDDPWRLCQFSVHMCQTLGLSGHAKDAVAFGQDAQILAESLEDVPLQAAAAVFLGTACFSLLNHRDAEDCFLKVLQLLDGDLSLEQFSLAGFPAVTAHGFLTRIYADRGTFTRGIGHGEEGVRLAEAVNHPYSLAIACWCLADLLTAKGELGRAIDLLERGLTVAREWSLPFLVAGNSGSLGYAYALLGRTAEGLPFLEQALSVFEKMGHRLAQALFLVPLGEAYMLADRPADALEFAGRALTLARESGQRSGEAGALHLLGEASVCADSPEHAEGHYREALALAAELDMRPLVARCHHGLGKLYLHSNQPDQARDQLVTATTMYREMDMRFWLEKTDAEMRQLQ
ncbi:AAA family ATPase [Tardiphaga sp.]|uniref:AAA family ATPase n=1 Tax=Tardiphaga sp. TaxID=1926292 RepID=UPI00352A82E1